MLPISKKKAIEKYYEQNGKQGETLQQFEEMNQDDIEKFVSSKNPIKKYAEAAKNENIAFKENDQNLIKANDKQEEKGKGLLTKFLMVVGGIALLGTWWEGEGKQYPVAKVCYKPHHIGIVENTVAIVVLRNVE